MRFVLFLLVLTTAVAAQVQLAPPPTQITIPFQEAGVPHFRYPMHAANGDATATTPEEVVAINRKLAADGNMEADFQLGIAYMQGAGVPVDLVEAKRLLVLGATTPDEKATLARLYESSEFFERDPAEAAHWLHEAGRPGDLFAEAEIYRMGASPDPARAAVIYRQLLSFPQTPEFRRAQMELGNLVLDGKYSAGDDAAGRKLNLEWARIITQELLGQQEYAVAIAHSGGTAAVPKDQKLWLRFCRRAAAYNVDLAQEFYGRAMLNHEIDKTSPYEGYAWIRLSSDKRYINRKVLEQLKTQMSDADLMQADSIFEGLVQTRLRDGAYYPSGDILKEPTTEELKSLPDDDPDVQLRRAFALESSSAPGDYTLAIEIYRIARDRRYMDIRVVLGRDYLYGTNGVAKDPALAKYWLTGAADAGSKPAALYLAKWYRGEGATTDPVQAQMFEMIGHEGPTPLPVPANLTGAQEVEANQDYAQWLEQHKPHPQTAPSPTSMAVRLGFPMPRPVVLYAPEAVFSEQAREAKFSGHVIVSLEVDENGDPQHIKVVRPIGMGLDEQAVKAVRQYKFRPAMLNGKPVSINMNIDVNFQMLTK